jgi:hypothetical protein
MKGYSLMLAYHHDYNCLSESQLHLWLLTPDPKQLDLFEAKQTAVERWYR